MSSNKEKKTKETKKKSKGLGFSVSDPEVHRPKELPFILKPDGGKWANDAQEEYARTLNAYAYANPEKWAVKKDELLKNLQNLEKNPGDIVLYRGNRQRVAYKNKLVE